MDVCLETVELLKAMGVTTDERGHLFVTDHYNHRIQMFSVSDGQYLGCLVIGAEINRGLCWLYYWEEKIRFPQGNTLV